MVVHFTAVLVIAALALAPAHAPRLLNAAIAATGVVGGVVALITTFNVFNYTTSGHITPFDHFAHGLIPLVAYVGIICAAILMTLHWQWWPEFLAAAVMLLMLINIRNAWDLTLSVVRRQSRREKRKRRL
ncbi:MAG: hypothetical protein ACR2K5_07100 [Pseudolabrys sp.]